MLQGHDGSIVYLLICDSYSDLLFGIPTPGKSPPFLWLHTLLTQICPPPDVHKVIRMDLGGETGRHPALCTLFLHHGYAIETTSSYASSQNGSMECPHSTIGHALQCMLHGTSLDYKYWPFAFTHFLRINAIMPKVISVESSYMRATGKQSDADKLHSFGS